MSCGIYCYKDSLNNDSIVYIGKDSNIDTYSRHRSHKDPSKYDAQPFNRILQNNMRRYHYEVLTSWESDKYPPILLTTLERCFIRKFNPKFNFTEGGEGVSGFKHSEETKAKMSESRKGEKNPRWKDYPRIIKSGMQCGKQSYAIMYNGKVVKQSIFLEKLEKELNLLINEVN